VSVQPLKFLRNVLKGRADCGCETCPVAAPSQPRTVMLVGSPNVGKSVIFNSLTGRYAVVSNYPGTTVEVSRGRARVQDALVTVIDSPGAYSLAPFSEDEEVTQRLLLDEKVDLVIHVLDAKNLRRMLPLTFQLVEAGVPLALDVNVIDEAERAGFTVLIDTLAQDLGLPTVASAATKGIGMDRLRALAGEASPKPSTFEVEYPGPIEEAVQRVGDLLHADYGIAPRAVALLLLQRESNMWERVSLRDPESAPEIERIVAATEGQYRNPLSYPIAVSRQRAADRIARRALSRETRPVHRDLRETLGILAMHPIAGIPILLAVLYLGLYQFVGRLGAGVVVDFLEQRVFEQAINPVAIRLFERLLPWELVRALFVGEYGLITLGLRYAFAIVLPLVAAFFLMFALLEDSGYLPRLALLVDRLFKRLGLSGRAVIPIVLGLGCDTMATLVTRVLETRRERMIATFLLALAIPCSAQLGVILGLLSMHPTGLAIWGGVVGGIFLLSGFLAAKLLPGEAARFYLEIPPMRWPSLRNVAVKTFARLKWYALEIIPIFLVASVLIWVGELTGLFEAALAALRPAVGLIGLPDATADAFLFGFFRRDYGAARIFDIHGQDAVSGIPLVVAMVTITLFVPCVAQFLVMVKERGVRTACAVGAIILPFAFGVGFFLNALLRALNVQI
jgi:ferrous iron transport protein B